jgi:hypothetical protein
MHYAKKTHGNEMIINDNKKGPMMKELSSTTNRLATKVY